MSTNRMLMTVAVLASVLVHEPMQAAGHPLDALDADEITKSTLMLRTKGFIDDKTPILNLSMLPPAKNEVLNWKPGDVIHRKALAVVRRESKTWEIILDLSGGKVDSAKVVPGPGQPFIVLDEIFAAIETTVSNREMQEALAKRGITNLEALFCAPRTGGNFGEPEEQTRRLAKVDCFDLTNNPTNIFAAPIEGLFALVDLEAREVLKVTDLGIVPVTGKRYSLAPDAQEQLRESKPVTIHAAEGGNIRIDGWQVSWQNWRFHLRWDWRAGLIISQVRYLQQGRERSVLYQGNISEIFVPYQDTSDGWYYRTYLDEGDYGLGNMHSPLIPGTDCPDNAVYLSPVMANPAGGADSLKQRICLFELPTGDATWRHFDLLSESLDGRPNVELVVRFIATVGNYDYLFDWVLDNKGQLTYRLGASGLDAVKGVKSDSLSADSAEADTEFGPLVAPGLAGINHDHFFSIRLDVDIDGPRNRFVRDRLVARRSPEGSKRSSIWKTERDVADNESRAKFRLSYEKPSLWRVESSEQTNHVGYPTSYALKPGGNARPLVDEDDNPLGRAQFVNYHLWVTPFAAGEQWAAGDYPNQSLPGQGLPDWTSAGRSVEDTDIVLWYTLGFHHVPSTEDWPVYNLGWSSVTLRPYNFFDENPAMDLPEGQTKSE